MFVSFAAIMTPLGKNVPLLIRRKRNCEINAIDVWCPHCNQTCGSSLFRHPGKRCVRIPPTADRLADKHLPIRQEQLALWKHTHTHTCIHIHSLFWTVH